MSEQIICTACARTFEVIPLDEWRADSVAECAYCGHPHSKQVAAQQCVNADVCPRCDGTGRTRNDGFVWVAGPACDGTGIRR